MHWKVSGYLPHMDSHGFVLYICTVHLLGSAVPLAQLIEFETTCENSRRLGCLEVKIEVETGDTIHLNYSPRSATLFQFYDES
jgi:hypothetical protein